MTSTEQESLSGGRKAIAVGAWLWVSVPFAYGVYSLFAKIGPLFSS